MNHVTIQVERAPDGTEYKRAVPYEPSVFPERLSDQAAVIVTPGQVTEAIYDEHGARIYGAGSDEDGPKKGKREKVPVARSETWRGYRLLSDAGHATRFTKTEAIDFAKSHKWSDKTHRIFKP